MRVAQRAGRKQAAAPTRAIRPPVERPAEGSSPSDEARDREFIGEFNVGHGYSVRQRCIRANDATGHRQAAEFARSTAPNEMPRSLGQAPLARTEPNRT